MTPSISMIVLATSGGEALVRTLDSVAWATEQIILAPTTAGTADIVGAVHTAQQALERAQGDWIGLVVEGEDSAAAFAAARAALEHAGDGARAYAMPEVIDAFGGCLRLRGMHVRLAPRRGSGIAIGTTLRIALTSPAPTVRLAEPVRRQVTYDLGEALDRLNAESAADARFLVAEAGTGRVRMALAPWLAGVRVLTGRADQALGWGRWILAVLAAYEAVVTAAKTWEARRDYPWEAP